MKDESDATQQVGTWYMYCMYLVMATMDKSTEGQAMLLAGSCQPGGKNDDADPIWLILSSLSRPQGVPNCPWGMRIQAKWGPFNCAWETPF